MAAQPLPEPQPKAVLRKERQTPVLRQLLFRPLNLESQHRLSFHPLSPPAFKGFTSQVRIHSPKTSMPRGLSYFFSPSISVLGQAATAGPRRFSGSVLGRDSGRGEPRFRPHRRSGIDLVFSKSLR